MKTHLSELILAVLMPVLLAGCAEPYQTAALGIGSAAFVGSSMPAQELEQIYYIGVFDEFEQVPPTIYRLTVRGQASLLSGMKFGSGWVPARIIDTLEGRVTWTSETLSASSSREEEVGGLKARRKLVQFGPEGFRDTPTDHRLVVVMGASPQAFFAAVDKFLGDAATVADASSNATVREQMLEARAEIRLARDRLQRLERETVDSLQ